MDLPSFHDDYLVSHTVDGEKRQITIRIKFARIFPDNQDVAFIDEIQEREEADPSLRDVITRVYKRRIAKRDVMGIHGVIFFGASRKKYYPTRRDEEAVGIR